MTPDLSLRSARPDSSRSDVPDRAATSTGDSFAGAAHFDTHFQPIVSVRRGAVLGVEALTRGRRADGGAVPPTEFFAAAERDGTVDAFDRRCRLLATARFAPLHHVDPALVCFVNCHVRTFLADVDGPDGWERLASEAGIDPRAIALEVLESADGDLDALAAATRAYRAAGFLVVIDDVGAGHSNLDRVAAIRPDLLKADRALVHGCAHDRVKRAVLRALIGLTEELGGWLVVEGVEREEDALTVLDLGADLLQGYYLARPAPLGSLAGLDDARRRTVTLAARYRAATRGRVLTARAARERRALFARATAHALTGTAPAAWDMALCSALETAPGDRDAASATVLDDAGVQLAPTVRSRAADVYERTLIFHAPHVGADHALKEYVYLLPDASDATFESTPYVPLPNEKLCVAVSTAFRDASGARRLLCLHLDAELADWPIDGGPPADSLGR